MNRLARAILTPVSQATIVIVGTYTTVWGLWLANPFWDVFNKAELYTQLALVAPEFVWGIIAIVCGVGIVFGALKPSRNTLIFAAAIAFVHWLVIAMFYFLGDIYSTGGVTSLTFAVLSAYIYLNTKMGE